MYLNGLATEDVRRLMSLILNSEGTSGPLAAALIDASIGIAEIATHSKDDWSAARANAICQNLAAALTEK